MKFMCGFLPLLAHFVSVITYPVPSDIMSPLGDSVKVTDQAPVIGYDCNRTEPEILTLSALEVGPCPTLTTLLPQVDIVYGQIVQKHMYTRAHVLTCQLTTSTFYFRCGGNWYNYQVYPPSVGTVVSITKDDCTNIHRKGIYKWSPTWPEWTNLQVNQTYQRSVNEIGWTDSKGYCDGGTYIIGDKVHDNVVVQKSLTLSIRESWTTVDIETGRINIENTLQCSYSKGHCFDALSGTHVWESTSFSCPEDHYIELYKGQVNLTKDPHDALTLLSVNNPPFLFSAELGTKTYLCSLSLHLTEFPEVFFLPQIQNSYQGTFKKPGTPDIKFITYLNAKMTFSYHSLLQSAQKMYLHAMQRSCEIERDVLKNRIEIIRLTSNAGALSTLLQGGMFAKANGEVIHVLKCEAVPVQLRNTEICYDALPIVSEGKEAFLLPNTHIITKNSSQIPCTPITPLTYKIGGKWWSYTGTFQPVAPPQIINPRGINEMQFTPIRSFSRGGMYSSDQIEAVQKLFSFPSLREAITTNIAAGVTHYFGKPIPLDISTIMSEHDYESIAKQNLKKMWGVFSSIGNAISGLIGIYFIYRVIKGVLNTFLDAKELYGVFGLSMKLFGAVWGRLTQYMLNQASRTTSKTQTEDSIKEEQPTSDSSRVSPTDIAPETECELLMRLYPRSILPSAPIPSHHETKM